MVLNIYSFVGDNGENIHIDSPKLRLWCIENKPEIFWIPLKYELLLEFRRDNVISQQRVIELSKRKHLDPIIMVKDGTIGANGGPNALLVDGHHRFVLACLRKLLVIEGHFLEVEQWKPFQIHGIPNMTKDQLRAAPITKRNY
jgi:hypothetical protein